MRLDTENQQVRLSWGGSPTPVEKVPRFTVPLSAQPHVRTSLGPARFLTEAKKPHSLALYCLVRGWLSLLQARRVPLRSAPVGVLTARAGSQLQCLTLPRGGASFRRSTCGPSVLRWPGGTRWLGGGGGTNTP